MHDGLEREEGGQLQVTIVSAAPGQALAPTCNPTHFSPDNYLTIRELRVGMTVSS